MKDRKKYLVKEGSAVFGWYYFINKNQIEVYLYTTGYVGIFELSHIENIEDFACYGVFAEDATVGGRLSYDVLFDLMR